MKRKTVAAWLTAVFALTAGGAEDEAAFLSPGEVSPAEVPAAQRETGGEEERP